MVQIRQSAIINASLADVWEILRDFNGHDRWHPAIASSHIEGGEASSRVGAVRNFRLADGSMLREQLLSLSDKTNSFSYCLLEAPLPLMDYVATVRLKPVTDTNQTFWEWSCKFNPPAHRRDELVELVTKQIYQAGFAAIRKHFGQAPAHIQPAPSTPTPLRPLPQAVAQSSRPVESTSGEMTTAIIVERHGGPEVLQVQKVRLPPPAAGEVRIRHSLIGVNYIDVYCRTGFFKLLDPPGTLGMEAAGIVEFVGAGVRDLVVGDRIAYACPPLGAYCERRNMAPDLLVRLPEDISDETAAAGLLKGVTASFLLTDIATVRRGDVVLVHAAAGGVGQLLVQWARHLGATVIATVSNDDKARLVGSLGADHVIVYSREDFAQAVLQITGGSGAKLIFDAVGRDTLAGSIEALAIRGHLVSFGQASGSIGEWDIDRFAAKSITFSRPNYSHYTDTPEKLGKHVSQFFEALRGGYVRLAPPTRFALANAADAHRHIQSRHSTGSTVLVV